MPSSMSLKLVGVTRAHAAVCRIARSASESHGCAIGAVVPNSGYELGFKRVDVLEIRFDVASQNQISRGAPKKEKCNKASSWKPTQLE
jgi:hypothetical protein